MHLNIVTEAFIATLLAFVGLLAWFLVRPTAYLCNHCGGVFDGRDLELTDASANARAATVGLCPHCREKCTHDLPSTY